MVSVFAGLVLVFVGLALLLSGRKNVEGTGVILIGPIPVVLRGAGVRVVVLFAVLALAFILLVLLLSGVVGSAGL